MKKILSFISSIPKFLLRHKLLVVIIALILLGGGFYYFNKKRSASNGFDTVAPEVRDIKQTLELSGTVEAGERADLHFQAGGKLVWLGAKEGDRVKKYQTLASLDKAALKKQLQKYLNTYQTNRWDFEQGRDNANVTHDNLSSFSLSDAVKRSLEQDQFSLNNAVLDVEIQDITNKLASIYTPIDGILVKAPTSVVPVNVLYTDTWTVVDPDSLYFLAEVDETDLSLVHENQSATITLDAFPDTPISANLYHLDFASSTSDSGGTVYKIKLSLEPGKVAYRLGLNGDVSVLIAEKLSVLSVPLDALIERDGDNFVKVIRNGQPEEIKVTVGIKNEDFVQITEGLSQNDQVVLPK